MSYQPFPLWAIQDASGVPRVGAKLKFFIGGTDTPQAVYSDRDRTISLGTSVTVDAAGNYGPIYFAEDAVYKVKITDSADVVLYTFDDVVAPGGTGTTILRTSRATSPLDYGAIGDGVADESAMVQDAIDDATGDIDLAGKTYRCDDEIVLKSGVRFYSGKLVLNSHTGTRCLSAIGTLATSTLLTANAAVGDLSVAVTSASGLAKGDICYLGSTTDWDVSTAPCNTGEIVKIQSVGGLTITLVSKVIGEYLVAGAAYLQKINAVENIVVEDVEISGADTASQDGIYFENATRCAVRNCSVIGMGASSFVVKGALDVTIRDCQTRGTTFETGYEISDARDVSIVDCLCEYAADQAYMALGTNAVSRNVVFKGCVSEGSAYGFYLQAGTHLCGIENSRAMGGSYGVLDAGSQNAVRSCLFRHVGVDGIISQTQRDYSLATGGGADPPSVTDVNGFDYCDNVFELCGSRGIHIDPRGSTTMTNGPWKISGNTFKGCDVDGVRIIVTNRIVSMIHITGNSLYECQTNGVNISVETPGIVYRMSCDGNIIYNPTNSSGYGVGASGNAVGLITNCRFSGNIIRGFDRAIKLVDVVSVEVDGNDIVTTTTAAAGIDIAFTSASGSDQRQVDVRNNGIESAGADGILLTLTGADLEVATISNNRIYGAFPTGIKLNTASGKQVEDIVVSGNDIRGTAASAVGIEINGNTALESVAAHVSGNYVQTDGNNIAVSAFTVASITGNNLLSASSVCAYFSECLTISAAGNQCSAVAGVAGNAILVNNDTNAILSCSISGNNCVGYIQVASTVTTSRDISISGNNVKLTSATRGIGVYSGAVMEGVHIASNQVAGDFSVAAIYLEAGGAGTGMGVIGIQSNNIRNADDGFPGILLATAAAGSMGPGFITGNFVSNGSVGIGETVATLTSIVAAGNYLVGCTAPFSGTWTNAETAINAAAAANTDLANLFTA